MVGEELFEKLASLKKASTEFSLYVNSIDGKKIMKESEVSTLERKIEELKSVHTQNQNKANTVLQAAHEEASKKVTDSKKILQDAWDVKNKALEDQAAAGKLMNEAKALMVQAAQKQKEADIAYTQYEDKRKRLMEAVK